MGEGVALKRGFRTGRKLLDATISATISAANTYSGVDGDGGPISRAIIIPGPSMLRGLLVLVGAPQGAAGVKTVQCSIGTVQNTDGDLADANEADVLVASNQFTEAGVHGDLAAHYATSVDEWFEDALDGHVIYLAEPATVYLNFIAKHATAETGTVGARVQVYALIDPL